MIAADRPIKRPAWARLLVVDQTGRVTQMPRANWLDVLRPGDLVDCERRRHAAGEHRRNPCDAPGSRSRRGLPACRAPVSATPAVFDVIVFGAGDYRTRTEDRLPPPALAAGDRLAFGTLAATVAELADHPRFVRVRFDAQGAAFWQNLARHGRPIQYAHIAEPLALWDVVDADRRSARRIRAAVGGIHASRGATSPRCTHAASASRR